MCVPVLLLCADVLQAVLASSPAAEGHRGLPGICLYVATARVGVDSLAGLLGGSTAAGQRGSGGEGPRSVQAYAVPGIVFHCICIPLSTLRSSRSSVGAIDMMLLRILYDTSLEV